jgi:hypothetical protein
MIDDEFEDLDDIDSFDEVINMDDDEVKKQLPEFSSIKLCDIIVCERYLGIGKDLVADCMEELAKRRIAGDPFNFEEYIDSSYKSLPQLDFSLLDLGNVLKQFGDSIKK